MHGDPATSWILPARSAWRAQKNARRKEMSVVEPYGTADLREEISKEEMPRREGPMARTAPPRRPRRGLRRGLGLLAGLIVLAVVSVLAYNFATRYFALNGAWYG